MKAKVFMMLCFLSISFGSCLEGVQAEETSEIRQLDPLIYERLKFKENTDYLHDRQKVEMKNTLPEKQFDIDFDGSKQLPDRSDTSFLFADVARGEKSTVTAMATEIGLFKAEASGSASHFKKKPQETFDQQVNASRLRTFVYIGVIMMGLLVLFGFLLPRLLNSPGLQRK